MNREFLGDVFDHWKGSLIEELSSAGLLQNISIDAMATDGSEWLPEDYDIYTHLLRVPSNVVLRHEFLLAVNRTAYFAEISHQGDLFLDPDTGIASGKRKPRFPPKYLFPFELHRLTDSPRRVVAVFQHVGRQRPRQRIENLMQKITSTGSKIVCCSYESVHVAMLFFCRDRNRVLAIQDHLYGLLGNHASKRIGFWDETS